MATFNYQAAQNAPQLAATQYNVQPNLSASRAIEGLQKSILGAMQLAGQVKADVSQENFEKATLEQQQSNAAFEASLIEMDYPSRKAAVAARTQERANLYDANNPYGRRLASAENNFLNGINQNLQREGVELEFLDNTTSQNLAFLDAKEKWGDADDEGKQQILAALKAEQIDPLVGREDKYSKKLLGSAQAALADFEGTYSKEQILKKDQALYSDGLNAAIAHINVNGILDQETRDQIIKDKFSGISTYGEKSAEVLRRFDDLVLNAILAKGKEEIGTNPTYDGAQLLLKNLTDYAKVSPKVKGSDGYLKVLNAANSYVNAVNAKDQASLSAMLTDDSASSKAVDQLANTLKNRGVISQEQVSSVNFRKSVLMETKTVKPQINAAYQTNDLNTLKQLKADGKGSQVETVLTANLELEFANLANQEGITATNAVGTILKKANDFAKEGLFVGKIESIDNILSMPANGGIKNAQDAALVVATMKEANKHNYNAGVRVKAQADIAVLEVWLNAGVPDIAEKFQNYKANPIRTTDKDVLAAYNNVVDNNEYFALDLTPANNERFRSALMPSIKALLKAGVPLDDTAEIFEQAVETQFMRIKPSMFSGSILMPRVGALNSEDAFKTVVNYFGTDKDVLPVNVFDPQGSWMVLDTKTGEVEEYPFEAIERVAKFGTPFEKNKDK